MRKRSEYKGGDNRRKPSKERRVMVGESNTLLPFLFELLKEQSRSSVKGLLSRGQISVNGKVTRQFDAPLNSNDTTMEEGRWNSTIRYLELFGKMMTSS